MFVIFYLLPFSTTKSDIKWFIKLPQRRYYTRTWTSMPTNYLVVQYQETVQRLKTFLFWPILTTNPSNYIQRTVCCYWHSAKQKLVICLSAIVNSWQLHGYDVDTTMMSCAHFCFVIRCIEWKTDREKETLKIEKLITRIAGNLKFYRNRDTAG